MDTPHAFSIWHHKAFAKSTWRTRASSLVRSSSQSHPFVFRFPFYISQFPIFRPFPILPYFHFPMFPFSPILELGNGGSPRTPSSFKHVELGAFPRENFVSFVWVYATWGLGFGFDPHRRHFSANVRMCKFITRIAFTDSLTT